MTATQIAISGYAVAVMQGWLARSLVFRLVLFAFVWNLTPAARPLRRE